VRTGLVGRRRDVDQVVVWLLDPSPGARAVEVVGEPGIGKTALIDATLAGLGAAALARIAATAVEQPLTWTGLGQLVDTWPAADLVGLAPAQRRAIDAAVGLDDEPVEPGLVAAAVAALFQAAAERGPAVVAVDDAHWIDDATAGVITYALRANRSRLLRLLIARRSVPAPIEPTRVLDATAVHSVDLRGLSTAGVHELLAGCGVHLARPQLVHVHETTGGNPLHVLEVARRLLGGDSIDDAVRQSSLESIIGQRVRAVPPPVVTVLGAAALTATPTLDVLAASLDGADVATAVAEAEAAGLVTVVDSTVRFSHPTVAAAADAALGSVARRTIHARLADAVDSDERAVHLDASVDGTDAHVADELERAAHDAAARGATELAAKRMQRAIARTPDGAVEQRWDRRIAAADLLLDAGSAREAFAVLDGDAELPDDVDLAARVIRTRAACRFHSNDEVAATRDLALVVEMFPAGHPARVDALLAWARMAIFFDVGASVEIAAQAAEEARATGDERLGETTRACMISSRFAFGEPVEIPAAVGRYDRRMNAGELLEEVQLWNDDVEHCEPRLADRLADADARGDMLSVANLSQMVGDARLRSADLAGATRLFERMLELALTMDDQAWTSTAHATLGYLDALCGRPDAARPHLAALDELVPSLAPNDVVGVAALAGKAQLLLDDADASIVHFRQAREATLATGGRDCNASAFRAEMVEALLAVGSFDEAREVADELMRFATHARRTRGIGDAHRAAALVAAADGDLDAARTSIEAATVEHDRLPGPLEGAWSRLCAGVIERRARRRVHARAYLEQARDVTRSVGAEALARRAEAELVRTGGRASGVDELTPAEELVAQLVAQGRTNAEVAAQLHMSAKTVEANLTRIYRKLGVRSRTELAARTT
jgi:DNA-binding CsgD family transcriptional regulator